MLFFLETSEKEIIVMQHAEKKIKLTLIMCDFLDFWENGSICNENKSVLVLYSERKSDMCKRWGDIQYIMLNVENKTYSKWHPLL